MRAHHRGPNVLFAIVASLVLSMAPAPTSAALTPPPSRSAGGPPPLPSLRQRTAGLRVAAGAALGNWPGLGRHRRGCLDRIIPEFQLLSRPDLVGLIASSTTMGAVIELQPPHLADSVGRQKTLVASSALFLTGGMLMGWSPTPATLIAGRFVGGMAAGVVSAAVPVHCGVHEPSQRGALATLPQFASLGHPARTLWRWRRCCMVARGASCSAFRSCRLSPRLLSFSHFRSRRDGC